MGEVDKGANESVLASVTGMSCSTQRPWDAFSLLLCPQSQGCFQWPAHAACHPRTALRLMDLCLQVWGTENAWDSAPYNC